MNEKSMQGIIERVAASEAADEYVEIDQKLDQMIEISASLVELLSKVKVRSDGEKKALDSAKKALEGGVLPYLVDVIDSLDLEEE